MVGMAVGVDSISQVQAHLVDEAEVSVHLITGEAHLPD